MHGATLPPATSAISPPAELFTAKTDTLGNLYAVTEDTQAHPIAVVPFEDLPICDDPGLALE